MTDITAEKLKDVMAQMVEALKLSEERQRLIRLRYGLEGKAPASLKELVKLMNMKPKQLKKEVEEVDRLVFNYLKNKI